MSTMLADRPDTAELHPASSSTVGASAPGVPDHVPAEIAAQHPDAAAVVSAARPQRGGLRFVPRGETRRSPALTVLALAAGATLATLTSSAAAPVERVEQATPAASVPAAGAAATSSGAAPHTSCPPGTPVVFRCDPPCPTLSPLAFPLGRCAPRS